jgi:GNAT superfamily N-acetyltransferase
MLEKVKGMTTKLISYHFILCDSPYYQLAVSLRHAVLYHHSGVQADKFIDGKEAKSTHLVAVLGDEVVGYIRISIEGKTAYLSQFVVAPEMQGKAGVAKTIYEKAMAKAKELGAKKVSGEIRLPMAGIASRLGYKVSKPVATVDNGTTQHRVEKEL